MNELDDQEEEIINEFITNKPLLKNLYKKHKEAIKKACKQAKRYWKDVPMFILDLIPIFRVEDFLSKDERWTVEDERDD